VIVNLVRVDDGVRVERSLRVLEVVVQQRGLLERRELVREDPVLVVGDVLVAALLALGRVAVRVEVRLLVAIVVTLDVIVRRAIAPEITSGPLLSSARSSSSCFAL